MCALAAERSVISLRSLELTLSGDTLETIIEVRGVQGEDRLLSRMVQAFDPSYQSLELEEALFGLPGSDMGPVPEWAVDTLTGVDGMPLSLVIAWPALREGMEISYRIRLLDWGGLWSRGPWAVIPPQMRNLTPEWTSIAFRGDVPRYYQWQGDCYELESSWRGLEFTSESPADTLWFTSFMTWEELEQAITSSTDSILALPFPPDLREAALQTTVAGSDPWMQLRLARSLICNSMELKISPSGGEGQFDIRNLQEVLDTRRATSLEHALLLAAMSEELGLQASILPASNTRPALPVPYGWERYLVRIRYENSGSSWLLEPSAYLAPAFYIHRPDTLYVLDNGDILTLRPAGAEENMLRENWILDPSDGSFSLSVDCRGWFDMTLRRMSAGMTPSELILIVSQWTWRSGRQAAPEAVAVTDPYDLAAHAGLEASGIWSYGGSIGPRVEMLPILNWDMPDAMGADIARTWTILGSVITGSGVGLAASYSDGMTILTMEGSCSTPPAVLLGTPE